MLLYYIVSDCIVSNFQFCNHLKEEKKADCFVIIVLQMYCYYKCSVALPHGVMGWFAVCDCGILMIHTFS